MPDQPHQHPTGDDAGQPDAGAIPVDGSSAAPPPPARKPGRPSLEGAPLIELADALPCPKCGAKMDHDAVVCMKCGYDMTAGRVRETAVGAPVEVVQAPEAVEFCAPGRLDTLALVIIGGILLGATMLVAGWMMPEAATAANRAASVGGVVLEVLIHVGTGLVAVAGAAALSKQRFGRVDLAAARIFVALCAFLLITRLRYDPPDAHTIVRAGVAFVQWVGGMTLYWLVVMGLFWKPPREAGLVGGLHLTLYLGLNVLVAAQAWLWTAAQVAAGAAK